MPTLIDRNGVRQDDWIRVSDDPTAVPDRAAVLMPLAEWLANRFTWKARAEKLGVLLGPADDPVAIADDLHELALIAVEFPAFTDGRGYSIARLLRERHGWTGELRAMGEVLRDQLFLLARCGFDTFALADGQPLDEALGAFADFSETYQSAVDRGPLFTRRSGAAETTR